MQPNCPDYRAAPGCMGSGERIDREGRGAAGGLGGGAERASMPHDRDRPTTETAPGRAGRALSPAAGRSMVAARRQRRGPGARRAARPGEAQSLASRSIPGTRRFGRSRKGPARRGVGTRIGAVPGARAGLRPLAALRYFLRRAPSRPTLGGASLGSGEHSLAGCLLRTRAFALAWSFGNTDLIEKIGGLSKMYNSEALNIAMSYFYLLDITTSPR